MFIEARSAAFIIFDISLSAVEKAQKCAQRKRTNKLPVGISIRINVNNTYSARMDSVSEFLHYYQQRHQHLPCRNQYGIFFHSIECRRTNESIYLELCECWWRRIRIKCDYCNKSLCAYDLFFSHLPILVPRGLSSCGLSLHVAHLRFAKERTIWLTKCKVRRTFALRTSVSVFLQNLTSWNHFFRWWKKFRSLGKCARYEWGCKHVFLYEQNLVKMMEMVSPCYSKWIYKKWWIAIIVMRIL